VNNGKAPGGQASVLVLERRGVAKKGLVKRGHEKPKKSNGEGRNKSRLLGKPSREGTRPPQLHKRGGIVESRT